jgi:hypothetical protein
MRDSARVGAAPEGTQERDRAGAPPFYTEAVISISYTIGVSVFCQEIRKFLK